MALSMEEMLEFQRALQKKYQGIWEGDEPATAKHHLLYAVEEIGEVSAILKKRTPRPCWRMRRCAGISARRWRMCLCIWPM